MKAIIIPQQLKRFYDKKLDGYNAIQPIELANGQHFLTQDVLTFLQSYADNISFPASVRESARLTKLELESLELREITDADLKSGELPAEVELFPYENLNIRVFIPHKGITEMTKSPYKLLIDLALLAVNEVGDAGVTLYLSRLDNEQMTAEQVTSVLESFGAQILYKTLNQ